MYPNGKTKALTFSYDDGLVQDRKLVGIFNKYGLKGTFNINSGLQSGAYKWPEEVNYPGPVKRLNISDLKELYTGHEAAVHGLTHPHLENLDRETLHDEIEQDKLNIERIFGYKITGMAYPYGGYNKLVEEEVKACGIRYARSVINTRSFDFPDNFPTIHPTCHHKDPNLFELAESFIKIKSSKPVLFCIWGHSCEFDWDNNWSVIEKFCKLISGIDDIFYGTNSQVFCTGNIDISDRTGGSYAGI
jgi:peptidoglycan/xylan/chitin deacetylase (PgdA/CDA1 family)